MILLQRAECLTYGRNSVYLNAPDVRPTARSKLPFLTSVVYTSARKKNGLDASVAITSCRKHFVLAFI